MSDGLLIAFASVCVAGITVGVPLIIAAFNTRKIVVQANKNAEEAAITAKQTSEAIGTKNGNGDLMQMAARALGENSEIFKQILELYNYSHFNVHELYSAITVVRGQTDILWEKAGFPPMTHPQRRSSDYTPLIESMWQRIADNEKERKPDDGSETE